MKTPGMQRQIIARVGEQIDRGQEDAEDEERREQGRSLQRVAEAAQQRGGACIGEKAPLGLGQVHALLGGQVRDRIKVYSWIGGDRPADTARAAKEAVSRGFTAIKMNGTEELQFFDSFEKVDLALRVGPLPDSGLRARRLGVIAQINVASPAYLGQHGTPGSPADLDRHFQVAYASPSTGRVADWEWIEGARTQTRPVAWRVSANTLVRRV